MIYLILGIAFIMAWTNFLEFRVIMTNPFKTLGYAVYDIHKKNEKDTDYFNAFCFLCNRG